MATYTMYIRRKKRVGGPPRPILLLGGPHVAVLDAQARAVLGRHKNGTRRVNGSGSWSRTGWRLKKYVLPTYCLYGFWEKGMLGTLRPIFTQPPVPASPGWPWRHPRFETRFPGHKLGHYGSVS